MLLHAFFILYTYRKYLLLFCSFSPLFPSFHGGQKGPSLLFLLFSRGFLQYLKNQDQRELSLSSPLAHWISLDFWRWALGMGPPLLHSSFNNLGRCPTCRLPAMCEGNRHSDSKMSMSSRKSHRTTRGNSLCTIAFDKKSELKLTLNLKANPVSHSSQSLMVDATLGYPGSMPFLTECDVLTKKNACSMNSLEAKS